MAELGADIKFCTNCGGDISALTWDDKIIHGRNCPEGWSRFPFCPRCGESYLPGGYERHADISCSAVIFQNELHDESDSSYSSDHADVQPRPLSMGWWPGLRAYVQRLRSKRHPDEV